MSRLERFLKNPRRSLFILAGPIAAGMLMQVLYNIVDTAFVGRLGSDAIAAVTFSFPIFFLLMALNNGMATGMSSLISRRLGAKKHNEASRAAYHGILLSMILAVVVILAFYFMLQPILLLFGADGDVLNSALGYMRIILLSSVFMMPMFISYHIFTAQGDTKTPVIAQAAILLLNIILDPIFIYYLGLGVNGAAYATMISFACGLIVFSVLLYKKSDVRVRHYAFDPKIVRQIIRVGLPASVMMVIMSVYIAFINRFMSHYGTDYVAAFGISSRVESFAIMPIFAISFGLMTLTGMFYGAKEYAKMKNIAWFGIRSAIGITVITGGAIFFLPELILRIFTQEPGLMEIGSRYLVINVFTFPLMAGGVCISRVMQGMGRGLPGLVTSIVRILVVAVPLAWLFVYVLEKEFIWVAYAMIAGGLVSNTISYIWLHLIFRTYK